MRLSQVIDFTSLDTKVYVSHPDKEGMLEINMIRVEHEIRGDVETKTLCLYSGMSYVVVREEN